MDDPIAYCGTFFVQGVIVTGHIYRFGSHYFAQWGFVAPDGDVTKQKNELMARNVPGAVSEAQQVIQAQLERHGFDVTEILMLHFSPIAATMPEWVGADPTHAAPAGVM